MCTDIAHRAEVSGSGKGPGGWFPLSHVNVGYDHPFHAPLEHTVNVDFVDEAGSRVAVELSAEAARTVARLLLRTAEQAERYEAHGAVRS